MAMDFRDLAKRQTTLSEVMLDREKITSDEIIQMYPDGITITAFDYVISKKTRKSYPIYNFAENVKVFANGGTILDRIFSEFVKACDGDVAAASAELRRQGGLKVRLYHGTTKAGDDLVCVEVV